MAADPVTMSVAALGLGAGKEILGGIGSFIGSEYEAERAKRAAEIGRIRADQTDTTMREELATTLGNIDAIRAAGNVALDSPTTRAIKAEETRISDRQRQTAVANIKAQVREDEEAARVKRLLGRFALGSSIIGAGIRIGSGLSYGGAGAAGGR
jgi:hypothetical protein